MICFDDFLAIVLVIHFDSLATFVVFPKFCDFSIFCDFWFFL